MKKQLVVLGLLLILMGVSGCRGYRSEKEPFHLNPNLDWQAKYKAQTLSLPAPEGSVAWGSGTVTSEHVERERYIKADTAFYEGKLASGQWVQQAPVRVTEEFMKRGQERFDIYCSVCHDAAGSGKGMVVKRGFVPPPNLADPRIVAYSDGELFNIVTNGIRNMPAYGKQIPEKDRWAIVVYLRALQLSQKSEAVVPTKSIPNQKTESK